MAQDVTIKVDVKGTMRFIWTDELADLVSEGQATIRRASHVEPTPGGLWGADLSPVNGPLLGPFQTRAEALRAEVAWLETNVMGVGNAN